MTRTSTLKPIDFNSKTFLPRPGRGHQCPVGGPAPAGVHGFYRVGDGRTHLYDHNGALAALVLHNHRQGHFVVTASIRNGKPWYMFSTCSTTETWLGLDALRHSEQEAAVRAFANAMAMAGGPVSPSPAEQLCGAQA